RRRRRVVRGSAAVGGAREGVVARSRSRGRMKELDEFERAFLDGKRHDADSALSRALSVANESDDARNELYAEAVRRLVHEHPGVAAGFALCAGALVESGADPAPLAMALRAPLVRMLESAAPFLERAHKLPAAPDGDDSDDVV